MHYESIRTVTLAWMAAASLAVVACGDDTNPPSADGTTSAASTSTTGSSTGGTVSATGQVDTTAGSESSTGLADGSFLDPDSSGADGPIPQGNGSQCADDAECVSGFCYQIPTIGGVCSECIDDDDCEMGTCSLDPMALHAVCTDGSLGVMCSSDEGCMGALVCAPLVDTGGLFPLDFCSECNDTTPCMGGQICTPVYDLDAFAGYLGCVDPGSVENGGGCPLDGLMGDGTVCQSGSCGVADLGGFVPLGVCGECLDDMDCMPMQTCTPPMADMTGLQGAVCM
ncbi:hypothetical protein [Paraliomyxa miuraensis]|uniref:hypothetical protein n=1 Tax=Paraliomyxa miuraensis TaxID=376150 RepID=UPI00224CFEB3|nr:hypothetical protein [Paraliomyxa miuraensis]MCX4240814.1 hypothetical protein [Paraliomyxa miuraensis]